MRLIKLTDFACSCDDEYKQECAEIKKWAIDFLNSKHTDYIVDDSNLLSQVVYYLSWYYQANITGIPNDPGGWSAVTAESYGETDNIKTYIECDHVEDGIVFTLKAFYDYYGPIRPGAPEDY